MMGRRQKLIDGDEVDIVHKCFVSYHRREVKRIKRQMNKRFRRTNNKEGFFFYE